MGLPQNSTTTVTREPPTFHCFDLPGILSIYSLTLCTFPFQKRCRSHPAGGPEVPKHPATESCVHLAESRGSKRKQLSQVAAKNNKTNNIYDNHLHFLSKRKLFLNPLLLSSAQALMAVLLRTKSGLVEALRSDAKLMAHRGSWSFRAHAPRPAGARDPNKPPSAVPHWLKAKVN